MVPYLHFEIVTAGNDFTGKQTMTDKQFKMYTNTELITAGKNFTEKHKMTDKPI